MARYFETYGTVRASRSERCARHARNGARVTRYRSAPGEICDLTLLGKAECVRKSSRRVKRPGARGARGAVKVSYVGGNDSYFPERNHSFKTVHQSLIKAGINRPMMAKTYPNTGRRNPKCANSSLTRRKITNSPSRNSGKSSFSELISSPRKKWRGVASFWLLHSMYKSKNA